MEFKNILIIAVIIIVLYLLYLWLFKDTTNYAIVKTTLKGNEQQTINANVLPNGGTSMNYTYSFWIYINDYNTSYNQKKVILDRHKTPSGENATTEHHAPLIYLGENENNLNVYITPEIKPPTFKLEESVKLEDLPLQKWCYVAVTLENKVLDIYLDGKLVTSHYYEKMRKSPKANDKIDINQSTSSDNANNDMTTWAGILSNVEYFDRALNAREVYERYKSGFTGAGGLLGGLGEDISKFNMKVSFLQDDVEVSQFKI